VNTEGKELSTRYVLDFCNLRPTNWAECSLRKDIRHLLVMGDSTAYRTFASLINTTVWSGAHCEVIRDEGSKSHNPSTRFYSAGFKSVEAALHWQERRCFTCRAAIYDCEMATSPGTYVVRLEFAPYFTMKDRSLTVPNATDEVKESKTFAEFLFQTYFALTGTPDLILLALPLHHDKSNPKYLDEFDWLLGEMIQHVPRTTEIHFLPTDTEFESKRFWWSDKINKTYGEENVLAANRIYLQNTRLFQRMLPYVTNDSYNMHTLVNLVNMSSTREKWSEDGVHSNGCIVQYGKFP
jgi:hypothetical protein